MSALGTKVKDLLMKHKPGRFLWSDNPIPLENLNGESEPLQLVQIAKEITDGLPPELCECILSFVQDDLETLQACSVVCREWKYLCDRWLFRQPLRAYSLTGQTGYKFKEPLRCAATHEETNTLLYGTARGIYYRDLSDPKDTPYMVYRMPDISQLDIVDRPIYRGGPFVVWRAARRIEMAPLRHFDYRTRAKDGFNKPQPVKWEGTADFYAVGILTGVGNPMGMEFLAAVNGKHRVLIKIDGNKFERDWGAEFTSSPISVSFVRNKVITVLPFDSGFRTMGYPNRAVGYIDKPTTMPARVSSSPWPVIVTHGRRRDGQSYIFVCYREFGMFMTDDWAWTSEVLIWKTYAHKIYFQDEYIFISSETRLEIRHMFNKDINRVMKGKFRFLSGQHADKVIVIRENGYIFGFRVGKDNSEELMIADADI